MLFPKDRGVKVSRLADGLAIEWRRDRTIGWSMIAMGVITLLAGATSALSGNRHALPRSPQDALLFMGLMAIFGLPMIYIGLACLINRNRIEANHSELKCTVGPLWSGRPVSLPMKGVKQFFATGNPSGGQSSIYVMDAMNEVHALSRVVPSAFAASHICHELNTYFGLEELPIHGVSDRLPSASRKSLGA